MGKSADIRILVAEPETATRRHICEFLERMGYTADNAADGAGVRRLLAEHEYALLLLDDGIVSDGGGNMERQIIDQYPDIPIVVLAASPTVLSVIGALRRGVFDYIIKPYELLELATIVPRAVGRLAGRATDLRGDRSTVEDVMAITDAVK